MRIEHTLEFEAKKGNPSPLSFYLFLLFILFYELSNVLEILNKSLHLRVSRLIVLCSQD